MPRINANPQTAAARAAGFLGRTGAELAQPVRSLAGNRPIVYPEKKARWCVGDKALTLETIDQMLGWREETPEQPFGDDYLFVFNGTKVRCLNNIRNRPIYWDRVLMLAQEHLHGKWKANGETLIIGRTALILNGQHTLIAAKVAEWERTKGPKAEHWQRVHPDPITVEKLVAYGVEETDEVINTMDTCKPRSLSDVIYRSPYFKDLRSKDRVTVSKMLDHAITFLWDRTGAKMDAYAPRRTHAEALDFLARHPKLEDAVRHIWNEYRADWDVSTKRVGAGMASGLLYLMAASGTPADRAARYHEGVRDGSACENHLDLGRWADACRFWTMVRAQAPEVVAITKALATCLDPLKGLGGTRDEKAAVLARAWAAFQVNPKGKLTAADLKLEYRPGGDAAPEALALSYGFGGPDRGNRVVKARVPEVEGGQARAGLDPTADDIARAKAEIDIRNGNGHRVAEREAEIARRHQELARKAPPTGRPR